MINKLKSNKAFTIIELIVVIAILGVLVLLAVDGYLGYTEKARIVQIKNDVKAHEIAIESEEILDNDYTSRWIEIDKSVLEDYRSSNSLYDKRGLVKKSEVLDDKYLLIPSGIVNTKLTGKFYLAKDGKVFYGKDGKVFVEDGVSDGKSKSLISAGHDFFLYMNNGKLQKMTFESMEVDGEIFERIEFDGEFIEGIFWLEEEFWNSIDDEKIAKYTDQIDEYSNMIDSDELGEEKINELYEKIYKIKLERIKEIIPKTNLNLSVENVDTSWTNNTNIIDIDTEVEMSKYNHYSRSFFLLDDNSVYRQYDNDRVGRLIYPDEFGVRVEETVEQEGFNFYVLSNSEIWYVGDNWYGMINPSSSTYEVNENKPWDESEAIRVFTLKLPGYEDEGYLYILNSGEIWISFSEPNAPEGFIYVKLDNVYISNDELPSKKPWEVENDNTPLPHVSKIQSRHGSIFITRSDGIYALGDNSDNKLGLGGENHNKYIVSYPIKVDIPNESIISPSRYSSSFSFNNKLFITSSNDSRGFEEVDVPWSSEKNITHTDGYVYVLDDGDVYIGERGHYEEFSQLEVKWEGNVEKIVNNAKSLERSVGSYVLLDNNEIWFISDFGYSYLYYKESKEIIDIDVNNYAIIMLFSNGEYKTILNTNPYIESST